MAKRDAGGAEFERYLKSVQAAFSRGDATEHTYRPALKALIESFTGKIQATNEPKHVACGAPDFIVTRGQTPLGYVETKDLGDDLSRTQRSKQLMRYRSGLANLILTDYLEFRWYVDSEPRLTARLGTPDAKGKIRRDKDGAEQVSELFRAFLQEQAATIGTPNELARRMAASARLIREAIAGALRQEDKGGKLHEQLTAFKDVLLHTLDADQFADMYAQTICYGLFAACCNAGDKDRKNFKRENAAFHIPQTNPFLRTMFGHIAGPDLDARVVWAVDDLAALLARCNMADILEDFGRRTRQEDPVVHFYETFLAEYDPRMREARGVYYTPEPVVSYIVRSIDHILKKSFKLPKGLADASKIKVPKAEGKGREEVHKVQILDPATGTGTFLHGVIDEIHASFAGNKGKWASYVREHLLPRLFGFEMLMAPYAVAHMKLGLQLAETGYGFRDDERLNIFLTNTLEEAHLTTEILFAQLIADEANQASRVKTDAPVMVVLGNPPYSGLSENKGKWIIRLLKEPLSFGSKAQGYYEIDGKPLGEKKVWLQDDYVKFIRFAQLRIEMTGYGVLAFISNHGYLDNPTFRGMRQSLMQTFDDIYILDLHGNTKKKEVCPDGSKDVNVFDIQQGVAIGLFVKRPRRKKSPARVRYAELWGLREERSDIDDATPAGGKYGWLLTHDVASTKWKSLKPSSPYYFFVPKDETWREEYEGGTGITDAMPVNVTGIVTARDKFVIDFDEQELLHRMNGFIDPQLSSEQAKEEYKLSENYAWRVADARRWLSADWKDSPSPAQWIKQILYRPFDRRLIFYHPAVVWRPRETVMRHMLAGENLGLGTTRSIEIGRGWEHVFCTRELIQHHSVSLKEVNYLYPLYLFPNSDTLIEESPFPPGRDGRRPNLDLKFVEDFANRLKLKFVTDGTGDLKKTFGPEDVFHYIYAVLHSPAYRARYAEFLKTDFPRIPLTSKRPQFRKLCGLGARLTALHLMEETGPTIAHYPVEGGNEVEKVRYTAPGEGAGKGRVWINGDQYFEGVPPEVWEFHVGGYQVCAKWLKDRKGRALTYDDLTHYCNIVAAIAETITVMSKIDAAIPDWPMR